MPREKLSVLIPAGNAERHIAACLDTVQWADEVTVVVDAASADRTEALARAAGARVMTHEYVSSAAQKNWAIPQMSHEWVLVVDADERVTPELRDEIVALLERGDGRHCAFRVWRKNHFMGKPLRFCWRGDDCVRLFRRDRSRYQDRQVHADIECDGPVGRLRGKLLHFTFDSFDQYMKTFDKFTTWGAVERAKRLRSVGWIHLTLRPAWHFFRRYFLDLGFLDGKAGLVVCGLGAFKVFLTYAKLWEQLRRRKGD
jgi:glycosyltransferase involved in cell wall biosynthesis